MKNYNYTVDWFGGGEDLKQIIKFDNESELHILEIGSFEGRSTIWFLENLLKNPKSTITCVDPWTSYSQNSDSFNSYNTEGTEWNFKSHKNTFVYEDTSIDLNTDCLNVIKINTTGKKTFEVKLSNPYVVNGDDRILGIKIVQIMIDQDVIF